MRREEIELDAGLPVTARGSTRAVAGRRRHGLGAHRSRALPSSRTGTSTTHVHSFEESFYVLEGEPVALPGRARRHAAARARAASSPSASRTPGVRTTDRPRWIEMTSPQPRARRTRPPDTFFLGRRPDVGAGAARRARSAQPQPLPARRPATWTSTRLKRGRRGRRADGLGEHGDGGARLQRHHREDARRQAPRRAAAHDVHGRLPARRGGAPARPSVRGVVLHARGRGRRRRRRRALHAAARRRVLDGRRLHPRLLRDEGRDGALARDVRARAAGPPLVPFRARLGVTSRPRR